MPTREQVKKIIRLAKEVVSLLHNNKEAAEMLSNFRYNIKKHEKDKSVNKFLADFINIVKNRNYLSNIKNVEETDPNLEKISNDVATKLEHFAHSLENEEVKNGLVQYFKDHTKFLAENKKIENAIEEKEHEDIIPGVVKMNWEHAVRQSIINPPEKSLLKYYDKSFMNEFNDIDKKIKENKVSDSEIVKFMEKYNGIVKRYQNDRHRSLVAKTLLKIASRLLLRDK